MKEGKTSLFGGVKAFVYDVKVKLHQKFGRKKKQKVYNKRLGQNVFLFFFLLFPIAQFLVFYVGVAANTIKLAFQAPEKVGNYLTGNYYFTLETFANVFKAFFVTGEMASMIKNSAWQFLTGLLISMPLQIMVAYVVFKEVPLAGAYKVILFLPNIISSLVFVICGRELMELGIPLIVGDPKLGLLNQYTQKSFYSVLVFGMWMNFANGLIIYLSAMCSISKDILEYGELEKMSSFQEFWYVVLPSIFPTIVTYIIVAIAAFFTNYGHFYSFYGGEGGANRPFSTLGFYFFVKVAGGTNTIPSPADYPFVSAAGIMFTLIVAPVTLITKYLLEKFGPSED